MPTWIEGTVVAERAWTERLFSLQVVSAIDSLEAGQFAKIALPVGGAVVSRRYSFVNAPGEVPCEFYYDIVPEGPLSPRLATLEPTDGVPRTGRIGHLRPRRGSGCGESLADRDGNRAGPVPVNAQHRQALEAV